MNVAVTGASGYLGQLVLALLDQHPGVDSILVSARTAREQLGWQPRFDSAGALLEFARQRNLFRRKDGWRP